MSISLCIAQWRPEGSVLTPRSRRSCEQCAQPDQIVGGRGEGDDPVDQFAAAVSELPQAADGFHPTEDLLDQFPLPLADGVARMPRRAIVDPRSGVLLGHMRRDAEFARRPHKSVDVEMLIAADGGGGGGLLEHQQRRLPFAGARRRRRTDVGNQPIEAEQAYRQAADHYDNATQLLGFYYRAVEVRKQTKYRDAWDTARERVFPNGLVRLTPSDARPAHGVIVTKDNPDVRAKGLQTGDIIIGLEGWQVDTLEEYRAVNAFYESDAMKLTVSRGKPFDFATTAPHRLMGIEFRTYPVQGWAVH